MVAERNERTIFVILQWVHFTQRQHCLGSHELPSLPCNHLQIWEKKKQVQLVGLKEAIHVCKGSYTGTSPKLWHTTAYGNKSSQQEGANPTKWKDLVSISLLPFSCIWQLKKSAGLPKQSPKLFFVFRTFTHQKAGVFKHLETESISIIKNRTKMHKQ